MTGEVEKPEKTYDPIVKEQEILRWWRTNKIYSKTCLQRQQGPKYFFLDGPPYVTNPPHVGTTWNKYLKDTIIRYKRMQGFNVHDQPGYDCHGLPIEVKVEESLKLKSKKDIEQLIGVAEFISKCKKYALENMEQQTRIFQDLGVWMDWNNPYLTLKNTYMESVWWTIKKSYEKKLLEKGVRVVHWCSRCETALAGYEATDEYRDIKDPSIFVKMPVKGEKGKYILIWTTTPWTIPANVAVMVHPDTDYVEVEVQDEIYILAEARCEIVFTAIDLLYRVKKRVKGAALEGMEYISPLEDEVPIQGTIEKAHRVVLSREYVTMDEGTGCVHCAPGHGEEDYEVGLEYHLPVLSPVDEKGKFTEKSGKYCGQPVKEADEKIIADLEKKGFLLHQTGVTHSYPHCWRCKTPLIMRAADQWFIKVTTFKDKLLHENSKVIWIPEWAGTRRFADWLKGARDWVISRQRFWGVPLPIWICNQCNSIRVIGSLDELKSKAVNPPDTVDLHRDYIDAITLRCRCEGVMHRIPDIVDVWMDSGVASWASLNFPQEQEFQKWWPADSITEAHDQTRGWFYTQLITSVLCFGKSPYKTVMMHGHTLDPQGQKMSKSLGNFISPVDVVTKYGRDALRLYELQNTVWEDFRFSIEKVEDAYRDIQVIWNVLSFAGLYMHLDDFTPSHWSIEKMITNMRDEDKWLLSRTEKVKSDVIKALDTFLIHEAARLIRNFLVEDLSHWYIRLVRRRFWLEKESRDKLAAYKILHHALSTWITLAAPFLPFLTEVAYRSLIAPTIDSPVESIHMLKYPTFHREWIDEGLEEDMESVKNVVAAVMSARQSLKLKLRQPVKEVTIFTDDNKVRRAAMKQERIILEAANTKSLKCAHAKEEKRIENLIGVPNYKIMGPIFKEKASQIAEIVRNVDGREIADQMEKVGFYNLELKGEGYRLTPNMITFREEMPSGFARGEFDRGRVYVDSQLSKDLIREGLSRDIIRRIQEMRRLMDLPVEAFIDVYIQVPIEDDKKSLQDYETYLREEIRAHNLTVTLPVSVKGEDVDFEKIWTIEERTFHIGIKKVEETRVNS